MGRAGRRAPPQRGGLPEVKRRGRGRNRKEGLEEAELLRLDLGAELEAPTGTGLVCDGRLSHDSPQEGPEPLLASLEELGLAQRCVRVECRPATPEELLLAQSPSPPPAEEETRGSGDPPGDPPVPGCPPLALGSLLQLLGKVWGRELRNGLVLLGPPAAEAVVMATRVAQQHLGVQRILLVDWWVQPGRPLPFQEDPRVLCFGGRWGGHDPPPTPGTGGGEGFTIELNWEQAGVTDGDLVAAAAHLLLPIACQFQPQLVLVTLGDPRGPPGVTPPGLALLTHLLMGLGGGRLVLVLQGGAHVGGLLSALLGDPRDPPPPMVPTPSGLASVSRALSVHRKYWSCLSCLEPEVEDEEEEEEEEEEDEEGLEGDGEVPEALPEEEEEEEDEEQVQAWARPAARTGLVYDERMEEHCNLWDSQHPERPQRVSRVLERLGELGLLQRCHRLPSRPARDPQLWACHTRGHVRALSRCAGLRPRELRVLAGRFRSVFLSPGSSRCARLAAGGACEAVGAVLRGQVQNALALVRPPGHHAGPASASGFCLFNNAAVAARHGQSLAGGALRVLIVDWDVHHGNGTQKIFEEDPSVLYISLHRHDGSFFPGGSGGSPKQRGRGPGTGFTLNVGWGGPRVGDPDYLAALTRLVLPVACQFAPQLVLVSAGFDAGRGDPLGGCLVSPQTFGLMTHLLGGLAGGRLVLILEGGYNLGALAEGVGQCLGVLLGAPPTLPPPGPPQPAALRALAQTWGAQRGLWSCLDLPPPEPPPAPPPPPDDVTPPRDDVTPPPDDVTAALGELDLGGGAEKDPPSGEVLRAGGEGQVGPPGAAPGSPQTPPPSVTPPP